MKNNIGIGIGIIVMAALISVSIISYTAKAEEAEVEVDIQGLVEQRIKDRIDEKIDLIVDEIFGGLFDDESTFGKASGYAHMQHESFLQGFSVGKRDEVSWDNDGALTTALDLYANSTSTDSTEGAIYYDTDDKLIKLWDGTQWANVATTTSGSVFYTISGSRLQLTTPASQYMTWGTTTAQNAALLTLEATSTLAVPLTLIAFEAQAANLFEIGYMTANTFTERFAIDAWGGASSTQLSVSSGVWLNGNTTIGDASTDTLTITAGASTTDMTIAGDLWLNGFATSTAGSGNFATQGTLTVLGDAIFDTDTLYVDVSADRVGISSTTPLAILSVSAEAGLNAFIIGSTTEIMQIDSNGNINMLEDSVGDLIVDTDTLFVDNSADRVGIGTTTPYATLSVETTAGDSAFVVGSSTATYFEIDSNGDALFDSSTLVVDVSTNRVGIGDTSPDAIFDVEAAAGTAAFNVGSSTSYMNLDSSGRLTVDTFTQAGGIRSTSTDDTSATFLSTDFDVENMIEFTPNVTGITATLPATSTLSEIIPTAGDHRSLMLCNATSTSGASFTLAAGAGMNLHQATSTLAIQDGDCATLEFYRASDTDIELYYDLGY